MEHLLKEHHLKITKHRVEMLEILNQTAEPMTAEQLCSLLTDHCNLSTVYRALKAMCDCSLLQKSVHQDGVVYYHLDRHEHRHHLICESCHARIPIEGCPFEELEQNLKSSTGYQIISHDFEIHGICPNCLKK